MPLVLCLTTSVPLQVFGATMADESAFSASDIGDRVTVMDPSVTVTEAESPTTGGDQSSFLQSPSHGDETEDSAVVIFEVCFSSEDPFSFHFLVVSTFLSFLCWLDGVVGGCMC